jgi:hypothetical protein
LLKVNPEDRENSIKNDHHNSKVDDSIGSEEGEVPSSEDAHDNFPKHRQHVVPDNVVQKLLLISVFLIYID